MSIIEKILNSSSGVCTKVKPKKIILNDSLSIETINSLLELDSIFDPSKLLVIFCYDTPAGSFDSAEKQKKLIAFAKKWKTEFIQSQGILYYVLDKQHVSANDVVISNGKHISFFGYKQALGLTVSEAQLIDVCKHGSVEIPVPETKVILLTGQLGDKVTVRDFMFDFLANSNQGKRFVGASLEFVTEKADLFTEKEIQDICTLAGQSGAVSTFFNSTADVTNAESFDLSLIKPNIALPGSIYNSAKFSQVQEQTLPVAACFIGGCTGGSIEDLREVAAILKDRHVHIDTRLTICPQTSEINIQALDEGLIDIFVNAGAQIINAGCGSCITTSKGVVGAGEILLSSSCWNYQGCAGSAEGKIYLASVAAVTKSAISGQFEI